MALEKSGKAHKANEFVLLEEVDEEGTLNNQRMMGLDEIPLNTKSSWKSDGIKEEIEEEEEHDVDKFLVCIFNISATVAHAIFHVNKSSTAEDLVKLAVERGRREDEHGRGFALVEETEVVDLRSKKGKKIKEQRVLDIDDNIYLIQSNWREQSGKLILMEKDKCTMRPKSYELHPSIRETQSDPVSSPRLRRPNNLVSRVRRFSRSLYHAGVGGFHANQDTNSSDNNAINNLEVLKEITSDESKPKLHR